MRPHIVRDLALAAAAQRGGGPAAVDAAESLAPDQLRAAVLAVVGEQARLLLRALAESVLPESKGAAPAPPPPQLRCTVAPSKQCGGLGLFATRPVAPGSLAAIYPGTVYAPEGEGAEGRLPPRSWRSEYLVANEYGWVYVDGKGWAPRQMQRELQDAILRDGLPAALWHFNRGAVGNYANHPPAGELPNCVPIGFHWPQWEGLVGGGAEPGGISAGQARSAWALLTPHVEVSAEGRVLRTASGPAPTPGSSEAPPREWRWGRMGLALVSVRPVREGDELLWNYRLQPRGGPGLDAPRLPSWYSAVDEDALRAAVAAQRSPLAACAAAAA